MSSNTIPVILLDSSNTALIPYVPVATNSVVGLVKPGTNLAITADGTLNYTAGIDLDTLLDIAFPIHTYYFSYTYSGTSSQKLCPLNSLREWTWYLAAESIITSVNATANVSDKSITVSDATGTVSSCTTDLSWTVSSATGTAVSIKGDGYASVSRPKNTDGRGTISSPNCYYYWGNGTTGSMSNGNPLAIMYKQDNQVHAFSTTAGYPGLTGTATLPNRSGSMSMSLSGQTISVSNQTALVSGQTATVSRVSQTCYIWRRTA